MSALGKMAGRALEWAARRLIGPFSAILIERLVSRFKRKRKPVTFPKTALTGVKQILLAGAKNAMNPLVLMLLGQLDTLLIFVYSQTGDTQKEVEKKAAQTVLIWIEYAETWALKTSSPYDDALVREVREACEAIISG